MFSLKEPQLILLLIKLAFSVPPEERGEDGHTAAHPVAPASAGVVHTTLLITSSNTFKMKIINFRGQV